MPYLLVIGYLPLWWAGGEMARLLREGLDWRRYLLVAAALMPVILVAPNGDVIADIELVAGLVLIVALAPSWSRRLFDRGFGWAAAIAPFSYGLYAVHEPLVTWWKPSASLPIRLLVCVPVAFLVAWVIESALRKGGWLPRAVVAGVRQAGRLSRDAPADRHLEPDVGA
jgi:peptidoglycan/LPS O-acetylase OafA/YrhL